MAYSQTHIHLCGHDGEDIPVSTRVVFPVVKSITELRDPYVEARIAGVIFFADRRFIPALRDFLARLEDLPETTATTTADSPACEAVPTVGR